MKIEITGERGSGTTWLSGILEKVLGQFGYAVTVTELNPDGAPMPQAAQDEMARLRNMDNARTFGQVGVRPVDITVRSYEKKETS